VAYECFHGIKRRRQGKKGFCAVKLDMHKAYDRVEWGFLEKIMLKMGFDRAWVKLVMTCVSTVRYRVRINSEESDIFSPSRGLRQGDPLSAYLFLLCAEGLTGMISRAEQQGELIGVRVCRDAPAITNLLFADDSLILMQADEGNASCLKRILDDYCKASGQLVSDAKSSIFFSPNTRVEDKEVICSILNILTEAMTDKYLGLPATVGMDRSDCFMFLVDRVIKRIDGWKEKLLSAGGREILLKAIAQAIPSYAMSVFKIPQKICKGIISAMSKYWWGDSANQKKMHWLAWWKMCVPKSKGGMGFRDIQCFNLALLAKQAWRLIDDPNSLCARVLRAKYFPTGDLLNAKLKSGSSFTWQSIWAGLQTFKKGHIWRVGQGTSINIWEDNWIPGGFSRKIFTPKGQNLLTRVSDLIDPYTNTWDEELLRQTFWLVDVKRILAIPLSNNGMEDFVSWNLTKTGIFSVRSAYHAEWESRFGHKVNGNHDGSMREHPMWKFIWKLKVPSKVKFFLWRVMQETIPCRAVLANRHVASSAQCPLCSQGAEDIRHLLFECIHAISVWEELGLLPLIQDACNVDRAGQSVLEAVLCVQRVPVPDVHAVSELVAVTCWYLWWSRRQITNDERTQGPRGAARAIEALHANFVAANSPNPRAKREGWLRPLQDYVKINVDASFDADTLKGTTGVVIRDSKGGFIAAANSKIEVALDALSAEAHAIKHGLSLGQSIGCNRIIISSDCLEAVRAMVEGDYLGPAYAIFEDCYQLVTEFPKNTFEHCHREANCVAHELARVARGSPVEVWLDDPPDFIRSLLLSDVTVVLEK
jgi:ribonuclease HI